MPRAVRKSILQNDNLPQSVSESPMASPLNQLSRKSKSFTPVLVVLLIIAAYLLGMLTTKVQYLEKQKDSGSGSTGTTAGTTAQQANNPPPSISKDDIKQWAKDIGLNTNQFNQCFDSEKFKSSIDKDTADGSKAGVSGTPSFFINGTLLVGAQPFDSFKSAIDKELAKENNSWLSLIGSAYAQAEPSPSAKVEVDNGVLPPLGNPNASVTIIEFSDFECPFCNRFFTETFPQIKKEYIDSGKAVLYYRHFPLQFHPNAVPFALAAECANEQGKFWEMHDKIFEEL